MKKVINGRMYDTTTARCVADWDNGLYGDRLYYWEESLYKKKTGEFFLYGWGGPGTHYSRSCGSNSWCGGEEIQPLSEAEARKLVEKHCNGEEYVEIFGEVEE